MITDEIMQEEQVEWPHRSSLGLNLWSSFQQTFTMHLGKQSWLLTKHFHLLVYHALVTEMRNIVSYF